MNTNDVLSVVPAVVPQWFDDSEEASQLRQSHRNNVLRALVADLKDAPAGDSPFDYHEGHVRAAWAAESGDHGYVETVEAWWLANKLEYGLAHFSWSEEERAVAAFEVKRIRKACEDAAWEVREQENDADRR